MTIWAFCKDPGGTAGLLPVVERLRKQYRVLLIASGKAVELLREADQDFVAYESVEQVLVDNPLPEALLTSMCSKGNMGRNLVSLLRGHCPTVVLQDHWVGSLWTSWAGSKYQPDFICVNDEIGAKMVLNAWPWFDRRWIIVIGYPALDKYSNYDVETAAATVRAKLNIAEQTPLVFYAGQVKRAGQVLLELVEALNTIGQDVYLIARPHPRMKDEVPEELPLWQKALNNFRAGEVILDSSSCDISSLVAASTVTTSMYSTVLVEAAALRKQNISMLYPEVGMAEFWRGSGSEIGEFPLVELGCSAKATNRQTLCNLLEKSLAGKLNLEVNQRKHFRLDGMNAERVADFISNLIN